MKCPACGARLGKNPAEALASHMYRMARASNPAHVMWLNQNISKKQVSERGLSELLTEFLDFSKTGLKKWLRLKFIQKFYGREPHPFVLALQHPSREVLLGYVIEHQHFLRQWVRSCSYIMARTEEEDVTLYELDNINTEFGGFGAERPSHYELLLRMGESLGLAREKVLSTPPLPDTRWALHVWDRIAARDDWVEAMAAMHGLELIADRSVKEDGATITYFDPRILSGNEVSSAAAAFLREGYEADVVHSGEALDLVEKYARTKGNEPDVQATFLRSLDAFDSYLMARLQRSRMLASP